MQPLFRLRRALWLSAAPSILALIFLTSGSAMPASTDAAPVATYTDVHGVQHSTADFKGHPTMLFPAVHLVRQLCGRAAQPECPRR